MVQIYDAQQLPSCVRGSLALGEWVQPAMPQAPSSAPGVATDWQGDAASSAPSRSQQIWEWCVLLRAGAPNGDVTKRPHKSPVAQGPVMPGANLPSSLKMGAVYR